MYPDKSQKLRDSTIPVWRIIPAYQSVKDLPELLPLENFHEILKAQDLIASAPCSCRYCTDGVGEPCNLHDETQEQVCLQFNRGAEYVVARGSGHALTIEEALDLADRIPQIGLIHVFANVGVMRGPTMSCQCCTDCCVDTVTADREGIPRTKSWSKSRFVAYVTQDECNGCQDCVERCPFDAIEMVKPEGSKKLKALVDPEKCYGCGVCVVGCETKALKMKCVRPLEHIVRPLEHIPAPAAKA
jgi:ferredoxin